MSRRITASPIRHSLLLALGVTACTPGARVPGVSGKPIVADSGAVRAMAAEQGTIGTSGTIGVLPFRVASSDRAITALGFALADLLTTDLSRSSRVQVVERARLGEVLRELDLSQSGRVDSATAPQVGRLLRAGRLVLGDLDSLPRGELRLGVRIAEVSTGLVTMGVDARAPLAEILAAEKTLAFRVLEELGVEVTPAERAQIEAQPTRSLAALTAYGRGVSAELTGDWRGALEAFRNASGADPGFRAAADRASNAQARVNANVGATALLPGIRGVDAPVVSVVDRLNRPIDNITSRARPLGGVSDPAFPGTTVTVVITVRRP